MNRPAAVLRFASHRRDRNESRTSTTKHSLLEPDILVEQPGNDKAITEAGNSWVENNRVHTAKQKKRNGRHEETRTPDLYRVKVAL
jgi:hypothetical protein